MAKNGLRWHRLHGLTRHGYTERVSIGIGDWHGMLRNDIVIENLSGNKGLIWHGVACHHRGRKGIFER
jgi:hypothetical protein